MKIKNFFMLILAVVFAFGSLYFFSACKNQETSSKISIVCTIFPEYDWVNNILGDNKDNFNVKLLMATGADLHSFRPSVEEIATVAMCDLFIYVGGESDDWVTKALANSVNENMITINLLEVLGENAKLEEEKEGMQSESGEEAEEDGELDEHVWLSLKNAQIFVSEIANKISALDQSNAEIYSQNASEYNGELSSLDAKYAQAVAAGSTKTLIFGDRFPFRYLVDDYNLNYYAAFKGCSAETEASFETITFLAQKVDELNIKYIFILEDSSADIASTIIANTTSKNQQTIRINSLQGVTTSGYQSYLAAMKTNLEAIKLAVI